MAFSFIIVGNTGQRAYSIRTRIKTTEVRCCFTLVQNFVREHIPLEQGLRLVCEQFIVDFLIAVREHIPLEQGLRRITLNHYLKRTHCQRAYSIRTRIKTTPRVGET